MKEKKIAVLCMLLSSFFLSAMQIVVKLSGQDLPMMEQVFARNFVTLLIGICIVMKQKEPLFGKRENQVALMLRAILGYLGVVGYFYATKNMLAADASILHRSSPFFVVIFSAMFLRERMTKLHIGVLLSALFGACLVIKPQMTSSMAPALVGLASAAFAGGAYTVIAYLKGKESNAVIIFYFSLVSCILSVATSWREFVMPNLYGWFMLLLIGVFAGLGQYFLTIAYKNAAAGEVSIYNYSGIIFACVLGTVFLGEVIDVLSGIGIVLIIGAALVLYFSRNGKKTTNDTLDATHS